MDFLTITGLMFFDQFIELIHEILKRMKGLIHLFQRF